MRMKELLNQWEKDSSEPQPTSVLEVKLKTTDTAKILALAEMFPGKSKEDIIRDLVVAGLQELEATMPYIPGPKIISEDEEGDPIYEDIGPTPKYKMLTKEQLQQSRKAELA